VAPPEPVVPPQRVGPPQGVVSPEGVVSPQRGMPQPVTSQSAVPQLAMKAAGPTTDVLSGQAAGSTSDTAPIAGATVTATPAGAAARHRGRVGVAGILGSSALAMVGVRMSALAIPWMVLITTHDPLRVGIVSMAELAPYVLSSIFSAPLQDRMGSRRTAYLADAVSATGMAAIALLHQLSFLLLVVLVAVVGTLRAASDRGRTTVLRPLIDQSGTPYARITSAYEGIQRTAGLTGAFLGGVAIALLGAGGALWLNAATFLASGLITAFVVPDPQQPLTTRRKEPYWRSLRLGFTYFRQDRLLPKMAQLFFVTNLFNQASAVIFIPLWVLTVLHSPMTLGLVAGAFAAGAIAGNIAFTAVAPYLPRYGALVVGYLIGGAPRILVLALTDNVVVVVCVMFVAGFAMCSVNPTMGAVIYQRVPGEMLARANGLISAASMASLPIGGLVGSLLVTQLGYAEGILVASVVYFAATLGPVLWPWAWREIDDVRTSPVAVAGLPPPMAWLHNARGLRVTLAYAGGEWSVRARRGLGQLLAPTVVTPKAAAVSLTQLGSGEVRAAVAGVLAAERFQARRRIGDLRERLTAAGQPIDD
jgi:MFS family permease